MDGLTFDSASICNLFQFLKIDSYGATNGERFNNIQITVLATLISIYRHIRWSKKKMDGLTIEIPSKKNIFQFLKIASYGATNGAIWLFYEFESLRSIYRLIRSQYKLHIRNGETMTNPMVYVLLKNIEVLK